jgi:catalase
MKPLDHAVPDVDPPSRIVAAAILSISAATSFAAPSTTAPAVLPNQTPQDLVNALHSAFGEHHARAVHAKGIILTGQFTADQSARSISEASIFASGSLPVTARFSDFTGIPDIPDTVGEANPRGFAFKIKATDGEEFDVVTHSFNGFPTATSDEFATFLRSVGASGAGVAHPTPIEQFLSTHPIAKSFLSSQKPPPASYATAAYFGVNALKYTNKSGQAAFVRYRLVPVAGEHYLNPPELQTKGANYLREEITARVRSAPVIFDWYAQVSESGDKIEDPSIAWPENRRLIKLGTLKISALADSAVADKQTLFLPGQAHAGIEAADPMLTLRNKAYPVSFGERQ